MRTKRASSRSGSFHALVPVLGANVPDRCLLAALWWLYCRGVIYVSLQACVVSAIAAYNMPLAFGCGFAVSFVWAGNVQAQAAGTWRDRVVYALGAGSGTVLGMIVGAWLA